MNHVLPYELMYSILLSLPYSSILDFCLTNRHYFQLWNDTHFWASKCYQDITKVIIEPYDITKVPFPYQ